MEQPGDSGSALGLLRRAQSGDGAAFAALVAPSLPVLLRIAARYTRSRDDAEEIVQQALLNAFRHLDNYRGDATFSTWLVRITINEALMFSRRKRPEVVSLENVHVESHRFCAIWAGETRTPEQVVASDEAVKTIYALMGRMRPAYRVVLALKAGASSHQEIAERLDIPLRTVRVRLHRARRELRRLLSDEEQAA